MIRNNPARARGRAERGVVLVPVMMVALLVAGLSLGLLIEVRGSVVSVRHEETRMQAFEIAEMGIVRAELEICGQHDGAADGVGNVSGAFAGGTYLVTAVQDPNSDERWILSARGEFGHSVRRIEVGVRRRASQNAVEGLYAKEELIFGGSGRTDAYDSAVGDYAAQAVNTDAGGSHAAPDGDIGSGMGISILGSSTYVRGHAIPGPGFATQVSGGATITGDTTPRLVGIDLSPTPEQEFLDAYNNNQNADLIGANAAAFPEETMDAIEDADLEALSDVQVDTLTATDLMTLTEAQADARTYETLLTENYTTYVPTVDPNLLALTKTEYDQYMYKLSLDGSQLQPVDSDPELVPVDGDAIAAPEESSPTTEKSAMATEGAGRVSYDAVTGELRATAGAEIVLNGGTYFFSDIRLVGNSKLIVRGDSKVYVTGRLDFGGGSVVNETNSPAGLRIYAHPYVLPASNPPSRTEVKLRGGAAIGAYIYAPEVDVTVGGGDNYYGAIIARNISLLGGVFFHYDKALSRVDNDNSACMERLFWREVGIRRR